MNEIHYGWLHNLKFGIKDHAVTPNLPPEFYLNQANGLGSSSAGIHSYILEKPSLWSQGTSGIIGTEETKNLKIDFLPDHNTFTILRICIRVKVM